MPKAIIDLLHPGTANGKTNGKSETLDDPNRYFMVYGKDAASETQLHGDPNRFFMVYGKDAASKKQLHDDPNRFFMVYGKDDASETQFLHDNPIVALFFLEKDLHLGTKLNMQFKKTSNYEVTFLPREVANSIPFSSNKVEKILNHFSIKQGSKESKIVKNTIIVSVKKMTSKESKRVRVL
ncbi:BURP domain protein RD22 [Medicago truncatula]|nr:BURP domain protein RD22 [Medicago truncatula]